VSEILKKVKLRNFSQIIIANYCTFALFLSQNNENDAFKTIAKISRKNLEAMILL